MDLPSTRRAFDSTCERCSISLWQNQETELLKCSTDVCDLQVEVACPGFIYKAERLTFDLSVDDLATLALGSAQLDVKLANQGLDTLVVIDWMVEILKVCWSHVFSLRLLVDVSSITLSAQKSTRLDFNFQFFVKCVIVR